MNLNSTQVAAREDNALLLLNFIAVNDSIGYANMSGRLFWANNVLRVG